MNRRAKKKAKKAQQGTQQALEDKGLQKNSGIQAPQNEKEVPQKVVEDETKKTLEVTSGVFVEPEFEVGEIAQEVVKEEVSSAIEKEDSVKAIVEEPATEEPKNIRDTLAENKASRKDVAERVSQRRVEKELQQGESGENLREVALENEISGEAQADATISKELEEIEENQVSDLSQAEKTTSELEKEATEEGQETGQESNEVGKREELFLQEDEESEEQEAEELPELAEAQQDSTKKVKKKVPRKAVAYVELRNGKKKKVRIRRRSAFGMAVASMLKLLLVVICVGLIGASVVAMQVSSYMAEETAGDGTLLDLDNLKLNLTSYIMAPNPDNPNAEEEGDYIQYQELVGPQHRIWVDYERIPENLTDAVVAIEDREFENHRGVSLRRSALAAVNMFVPLSSNEFGASTIEQQLVKNITGDDETDYTRKLREMYRAWGLDARYSKETIMEAYLNTISLSGMIAGVQAGARDYFNKDVWDLNLAECALIAGITRAPSYYSPFEEPERCLTRRNQVLYQMLETEKITQAEYEEARVQPLGVVEKQNSEDNDSSNSATFSYFSDAVFTDVMNDLVKKYGYTEEVARNYMYTGGLRIEATVDVNLQKSMDEIFLHGYDDTEEAFFTNLKDPSSGRAYKSRLAVTEKVYDDNKVLIETKEVLPQAAMTTVDYSGAVKALAGGIGAKDSSLTLNRATQSLRQVGSTMKPIGAYAPAIDQGIISYSSMVMDSGVMSREGTATKRNEETGALVYNWPKNYSNTYSNKTMPVVSAVAESTNTVAVRVGMRVGIDNMYDFLTNKVGITSLVSEGNPSDKGPAALILGSMTHGISSRELAGAYQIFGNGGEFNTTHTYLRVLDSQGNVILEPDITHEQAISPEASYVMNRMLYTVLHNGIAPGVYSTAKGMALEGEMESVAKTGTTSDDVDRWFVGLTPYYVTSVWWGYDNPKYDFNNKWSPVATGNPPAVLWKTIMEKQQENMPVIGFPEMPEGVVEDYYCSTTGERAGKYCPKSSKKGYFIVADGDEYCTAHTSYVAASTANETDVVA